MAGPASMLAYELVRGGWLYWECPLCDKPSHVHNGFEAAKVNYQYHYQMRSLQRGGLRIWSWGVPSLFQCEKV